jgi:ribosomal protein L35AE/L33A
VKKHNMYIYGRALTGNSTICTYMYGRVTMRLRTTICKITGVNEREEAECVRSFMGVLQWEEAQFA